jgi:hypothetical protein
MRPTALVALQTHLTVVERFVFGAFVELKDALFLEFARQTTDTRYRPQQSPDVARRAEAQD